jgi:fructosamine-3-kinase
VTARHPLLRGDVIDAIRRAASDHLGRPWADDGFTDLSDRASHPAGILHGSAFSVFAKLGSATDAGGQFSAELAGLSLLARRASVLTPTPVAAGVVSVEAGSLLLFEALPERTGQARSVADLRSAGRALATVHQVHDERFGLAEFDGFFGPFPQDNRPVRGSRWADFYAERRVAPMLRRAVDSGNLPQDLARQVEQLMARLPDRCGPEPRPALLHGDAQQNNFLCSPSGAVLIDVCPYFGHPELDLALLGYFEPVPDEVFAGYRDVADLDAGFTGRRELWRIHAYLAVVSADADDEFGRRFLVRLAEAVRRFA